MQRAQCRHCNAGGWFHTGDQGYLDEDGYLVLTGRIKELINVAGEKVSPVEVGPRQVVKLAYVLGAVDCQHESSDTPFKA